MRFTTTGKFLVALVGVAIIGGVWYYRISTSPGTPSSTLWPDAILHRPLRVGVVTWPGYAGGIVANSGFEPNKNSIYWKKYKLPVKFMLMEDVDARAKAFVKGGDDGVDIVWSTVDFWANELPGFLKSDVKARAIMQVDWSRGGDALVADQSIKRIEDLTGKKISLALFTPSHWLLEYSITNSSLSEAQQEQIVKGLVGKNASPDARADFVSGRVDAAVVWEPDVAEAIQKRPNSHVVVSTQQAQKLIADLMVAREDFIKEHPAVIEAFVEGWLLDGTTEANKNPGQVVKLLMENEAVYKDLGEEVTRAGLPTVRWADLSDNTEMFGLDGTEPLFDKIFDKASQAWVRRGYISAGASPSLAKDDSFLRKIFARNPVEVIEAPPPAAPAAAASKPSISNLQINIFFPTGSSEVDPNAQQILDDRVALLPKTFSGAYIRVEGNTDNVGDALSNKRLSERRARAAVDYLVKKHHLPLTQFIVIGNGPEKPLVVDGKPVSNDTPEGRARNRRTEVAIVAR
jgi:NitT/TauT family transport system substrate-binding protein